MSELRSYFFELAAAILPKGIVLDECCDRDVGANEFHGWLVDERSKKVVIVRFSPSLAASRARASTTLIREIEAELDYGVARLRPPQPAFRIGLRSPKRLQFPPRAP